MTKRWMTLLILVLILLPLNAALADSDSAGLACFSDGRPKEKQSSALDDWEGEDTAYEGGLYGFSVWHMYGYADEEGYVVSSLEVAWDHSPQGLK